jgi:hypothetical protein
LTFGFLRCSELLGIVISRYSQVVPAAALPSNSTLFRIKPKKIFIYFDFDLLNNTFEFNDFMVIDEKFKTINELVDYFNKNYFSVIKYYSKRALKYARDEMQDWFNGNDD